MSQRSAARPRGDASGQNPALRVYTLGRFLIEVAGNPLRFEAKARRKPLELLKVLIALGGETVPVEQLIESLWPDSDGDRAHSAFTTNLGRLRKLVGAEPLVLQDGRLTLDERQCWVDAWAFTAHLRNALRTLEDEGPDGAWRHMEQALGLYRGPFLEGEFDPPELLSARERLHGQFLRHIERLGELLMERHDYGRAVELYQQGLEVDDLAEELYQHLMRCYLAQGRLVEGVAVYKRCKEIFRASVGIDPSPETEALHRALLSAQTTAPQAAAPQAHARAGAAPVDSAQPAPAAAAPAAPVAHVIAGLGIVAAQPPSPAALQEAERRTCSVAYLSLFGYAAMNARLDPEEADEIMTGLRREAERVARRHGGILNETVRNAMQLLFGAPVAHEDDPVRAVRAALELQTLAHALAPELEARLGEPLRIGAGVYTGLMVVQPRSEGGGRYDLVGDAVSIGSELMGLAVADELLVGPETRRRVSDFFASEPLEPVELPGRTVPLQPFRIIGRLDVHSRFEAARQRGLTAFTGRDRELAQLRSCLERTLASEGQFVTVVGEPGMGKSRLLHEFRQGLDREQWLVLECRTQASGVVTPYAPFQDGLRRGLRVREGDSMEESVSKVVQNILAVDSALKPYLPYYLYLLSLPSPDHPLPARLEAGELRQALQEAIAAIGIQTTHQRPMLLLFEDWQWVDDASMDTLKLLVSMMALHRLMIVVTYRTEFPVSWGHLSHHSDVVLHPLDATQTAQMVQSVLGAKFLPPGLAERIQERTGGNPFFIEEVCSSLREQGALQVQNGTAALTRGLDELLMPDSVQAIIQTRVDRLDADTQQALRLASVIGREFSLRLLQRIASQDVDLQGCLARLQAQELIQQTRVLPDPAYRFKHVLTQSVVYETLLRQQRRKLHQLVGESLESLNAGRLEEHFESLAYHYQRGNDAAVALRYLELAGDKAAQSSALVSARVHYQGAVELADTLAQDDALKRKRIDLSLKWARASQYSTTPAHIEVLRVSQAQAEELGDLERRAHVLYWRGRLLYVLGLLRESSAHFQEAWRAAETLGHQELIARCTSFMGRYCWHRGEYAEGIAHLTKALPLLQALDSADDVLYLESMLATVRGWQGAFAESIALLERVIAQAHEQHNLTRESAATVFLSMVRALRGDWADAAAYGKAGQEGADRLGNEAIACMGRWTRGYATFMLGERVDGLSLLEDVPRWPKDGRPGRMLLFPAWLAEMQALAGSGKAAQAAAAQALEIHEQIGHRTGLPVAHRALGLATRLARSPNWNQAAGHLRDSLRDAEDSGAEPEAAITRFRLAELYLAQGDRAAGLAELTRAAGQFETMDMPYWREQAAALQQGLATARAAR